MKKAMKAALCILSAITMISGSVQSASAGTLSKEELIGKYAPNGAYDVNALMVPGAELVFYNADDTEMDIKSYVQSLMDAIDAENMTDEEYQKAKEELMQKTLAAIQSADHKAYAYNDYRSGYNHQQWFKNCEYADGFWYILRENGTVSIVGAEQESFTGKEVMEIPSVLAGKTVTKIENGAFTSAYSYLPHINEIVLPASVEIIGDYAFADAMIGTDCKIVLAEGVKYIGRYAFNGSAQCLGDKYFVIRIPESVEFIGKDALSNGLVEGFGNADDEFAHLNGFKKGVTCILDMPESCVMIEDDSVENDEPLITSDTVRNLTYAQINTRPQDEVNAIMKVFTTAIFKNHLDFELIRKDMLNSDAPLSDFDLLILNDLEQNPYYAFSTIYGNNVSGLSHVLDFCDAYDMTKQRLIPQYRFGDGRFCTFLYDEANYIDLSDVSAYYAKAEEKPETVTVLAGDANADGTIDVGDAVLLSRYCAEDTGITLTADGKFNADANGDGSITLDDVNEILRIVAKF